MLDVWGCPVVEKRTPGGWRCRVAFGPGTGEPTPPEGWEMRVTHPDDDYRCVFFQAVAPNVGEYPDWEVARSDPEGYWPLVEAGLMKAYDQLVESLIERWPDWQAEVA